MLRYLTGVTAALVLALPVSAGELDREFAGKPGAVAGKASPSETGAQAAKVGELLGELDDESPTQAWRRHGYGGWRHGGWGWRGHGWGGYGWRGYGWGYPRYSFSLSLGYGGYGGYGGWYRPWYHGYYRPYYYPISYAYYPAYSYYYPSWGYCW